MNILKRFKRLFRKKPKDQFPGHKFVIKEAFIAGGKQYYQFEDQHNLPCFRALKTMTYYNEMKMRVDSDYLERHVKAMKTILTSNKVDIYKINTLNEYMAERLKWIVDVDIVYKLASVVYFDESESPYDYDFAYNQKKIKEWKELMSVNDFFYSAPILNLIPFLKDLDVNLDEFSTVTAQGKEAMHKTLSDILAN